MNYVAALIAALSMTLFAAAQQIKTGQIAGQVVDEMGAVIPRADVFVRAYSAGDKIDIVTHTDRNGGFVLTLPGGAYDVIVSSDGFKSSIQTVIVRSGKDNKIRYRMVFEGCDFPGANCDTFQ